MVMERVRDVGGVSKGVPAGSSIDIQVNLNVNPALKNPCLLQNSEDF
jgi:hypothetical protein